MAYLLDTGILLRLVDETDGQHDVVKQAVSRLGDQREALYITTQNFAEFWNVATRPRTNNGLELPIATVIQLYDRAIEPISSVLVELPAVHAEYKRLLIKHSVVGKQVHDARLVAMMLNWQIERILTLNERNFLRYEQEGITVVTPDAIVAGDAN